MPSLIDPTKPVDGVDAHKPDMRANFAAAKSEIEALQTATVPIPVEKGGAQIVTGLKSLNFSGDGVAVSDAGNGEALVSIPGAGQSNLVVEKDNAPVVTPVGAINFSGSGVTVQDAGGGQANVVIPGGVGGGAATDGRTIVEGTDFTPGGTFTIDPDNAAHRHLKVQGSAANSSLLTANMTVNVAPAAAGWGTLKGQDATVIVEKADTSAFIVTVQGSNANGAGTRELRVRDQWVALVRQTGPGGLGPLGEFFAAITGGVGSRQAVRELLVSGASAVATVATDVVPLYDSAGVFRGLASASSFLTAHSHTLLDITDKGDMAGLNLADQATAEAGTDNASGMSPLSTRQQASTFPYIDGRDGQPSEVNTITNALAGALIDFNQNITLANTCAPISATVKRMVTLRNRDVVQRTITVQAGSGGTGTIDGSSTYNVPAGGVVSLWFMSNVTGDQPTVEAVGAKAFVDLGIGSASTFQNAAATRTALGAIAAGDTVGLVLKDYSEAISSQSGVTGALVLNYINGQKQTITFGAGNITSVTINNWPPTGEFGSLTVDYIQDGTGGRTLADPAATSWFGGAPTYNTGAGKRNRVVYTTENGGTSIQAHYAGAI